MKKNLLFFAGFIWIIVSVGVVRAQIGTIVTWASTSFGACNIAVDNSGLIYTASGSQILRIDSGGTTHFVVGGGSSYGDGGPATAAQLNNATNLFFDNSGDMFITDYGQGVIRKVNSSGIISTVAGSPSSGPGYSGDGGPATAALVDCRRGCVDLSGNIYIADINHEVIRKVNTSGIITTVAGNGGSSYSGDGGPATAASFDLTYGPCGIATDAFGNLYISDGSNYRVRMVNSSGIITTIAGNGSSGSSGVGGPATAANIYYPQGLTVDAAGNLYIAEWQNCVLAAVNTAGILNTVAGNYSISYSGDGGPATAAAMNAVSDVAIDPFGDIYIADCHNDCIRKVTGSYLHVTHVADSFGVFVNELCSGPQLSISTHSYSSSYSLKSYYGDGTKDSSGITSGYSGGGHAHFTHAYSVPGTYTIKTVLMNVGLAVDSLAYSYDYRLCNTMTTQYYYDADGNCIYGSGDGPISLPLLTEVDSNGISIDTISSTCGIYYRAYGNPGDVYEFRVIGSVGNMHASCPYTAVIIDTLQSGMYNTNLKSMAFVCDTSAGYDLSVNAVIPVTGVNDQWGNIYIQNTHCAPVNAIVTLHYCNHYQASAGTIHPAATSITDSTITWNVAGLSSSATAPVNLYYAIWVNPDSGMVVGYPARSYITVTPTAGDMDTSNNHQTRVDSVRGGCDPNEMEVNPSGYILAGTPLQYTINFTNTGNDTTYNVYVMDTLSDNVDISSFRLVMSSAPMNVAKFRSGGHNILKFDFPNINLLDSLHHPHDCSRGLVFNINSKAGLPDGTTIFNHAGIFFDYNPVVTTNTVEDIIGHPSKVNITNVVPGTIQLYPNPANNVLYVDKVEFATSYTLSNIMGATLQQGELRQGRNSLDIEGFPKGLYLLKVSGIEVKKFMKQ